MNPNIPVVWLGIWLALEALRHGAVVLGSPGTGKSVMLKAFRGSLAALMMMRPKSDVLLVDFDPKRDLHKIHRAFPDFCPVFNVNPFVWADKYDPTGDLEDPRDITELMAQMIDIGTNSSQPFFPQAARFVLNRATTRHWIMAPDKLEFSDLVLTGNDPVRLRMVAGSHSYSKNALALVNDTDAGMSVLATLLNEVSKFDVIAALMKTNATGRRVSVRSFLKNRFAVLSLPYDDTSVETLAPFSRLFLAKLQPVLLAENAPDRHVVLVLDELALIPKGVDLSLAAVKGREAGLDVVSAFQSVTMARNVFSKDRFDSMMSTPKTVVVLNMPARDDAEWAAKRLSDHQGFLRIESHSRTSGASGGSSTSGWSESFVTLDNVTPGMIQALPVPTPANPIIEGFMATIPFKPFHFKLHIPSLLDALVPKVAPTAPPAPRGPKEMLLREWTDADLRRLRLK